MKIGFIGFGEANSCIALGLRGEGVEKMYCYDVMQNDPRFSVNLKEKCAASSTEMMGSSVDVVRACDVVFAGVPANFSLSAAKEALPGLHEGLIYVDVSTDTPANKKTAASLYDKDGACYVDGAMMGPLTTNKHRVPMLLSGKGAQKLSDSMQPYHTRMTVQAGDAGVATSIKFVRSIIAKGSGCLLFEAMQAAQHYGVEETIVESILESFGPGYQTVFDNYIAGAIIHAERREHELANVVDFLKQDNLPSQMAEAAREKLAWMRDNNIKGNFEGDVPRNWRDLLKKWKLND